MGLALEKMIAGRYLRSRKRDSFISVIAGFSFLGIMLGVATLIIVMSVMNGFRSELIGRILGLNGHLNVYSMSGPLTNYGAIIKNLESSIPDVKVVFPTIEGQALMTMDGQASGVIVRGLRQGDFKRKPILADSAEKGSFLALEGNWVAVGTNMAERYGLDIGSKIVLIAPKGRASPFGTIPRTRSYQIAAIFDVGMYEYNNSFIFMPLETAQLFFQMGEGVSALEVMTSNPSNLDLVKEGILEELQGRAGIADWRQNNSSFYNALEVERNVMFLILTLIIIVAAFNIISSLIMLVKDKSHDIAILRTMGASRGMIIRIFFYTGASIGALGTFAGGLLGVLFAQNIGAIQRWLENLTGTELFAEEIYFLSQLPAQMDVGEVTTVIVMALVWSFLATIYPAWRAARLDPVEALRYE